MQIHGWGLEDVVLQIVLWQPEKWLGWHISSFACFLCSMLSQTWYLQISLLQVESNMIFTNLFSSRWWSQHDVYKYLCSRWWSRWNRGGMPLSPWCLSRRGQCSGTNRSGRINQRWHDVVTIDQNVETAAPGVDNRLQTLQLNMYNCASTVGGLSLAIIWYYY